MRTLPVLSASVIAASVIAAAAPAVAADLDLLPPLPEIHQPAHAEPIGAGWYLRGDIGFAKHQRPKVRGVTPLGIFPSAGEKLDDAFALGAGVGYRFGSWLRADVTVDHRFATGGTFFRDPIFAPGAELTGRFASTTALANAYLDLGTWGGFTPYVGAGIGYAWNTVSDLRFVGLDTGLRDKTFGSLAWALMAGVAVDAGRSMKVDLGYRYVRLGNARTAATPIGYGEARGLSAHEARVGVRWTFDAPHAPTAPISRAF